jgi:AraC-like DNA-binding protein
MKTPEQMFKLVEAFLLKKVQNIKEPLPIDHTFSLLIAAPDRSNIAQLANLACVSLRQFERQFLERIGTNPTTFIRQARFAKALRLKRSCPQLSWTAVAYECGYFDQMHFIRDFKQFTSATPTSFTNFVAVPSLQTPKLSFLYYFLPLPVTKFTL